MQNINGLSQFHEYAAYSVIIPNSFSSLSMKDMSSLAKTNHAINQLTVTVVSTHMNKRFQNFIDCIFKNLTSETSRQMMHEFKKGFQETSLSSIQAYVLRKLVYLSILAYRLEDSEIEAVNSFLVTHKKSQDVFFTRCLDNLITQKQFERELEQDSLKTLKNKFLKTLAVGQFSRAEQILKLLPLRFNVRVHRVYSVINQKQLDLAIMNQNKYALLNAPFFHANERKVVVSDIFNESIEYWLKNDPFSEQSQTTITKILSYGELASFEFKIAIQSVITALFEHLVIKQDFNHAEAFLPYLNRKDKAFFFFEKFQANLLPEQEANQALMQLEEDDKNIIQCLLALKSRNFSDALIYGNLIQSESIFFEQLASETAKLLVEGPGLAGFNPSRTNNAFIQKVLIHFIEEKLAKNYLHEACAALNLMNTTFNKDLLARKVFFKCVESLQHQLGFKVISQIKCPSTAQELKSYYQTSLGNLNSNQDILDSELMDKFQLLAPLHFSEQLKIYDQLKCAQNTTKASLAITTRFINSNYSIENILDLIECNLSLPTQNAMKTQLAQRYFQNKMFAASIRCADALSDPVHRKLLLKNILSKPPFNNDSCDEQIDFLASINPEEKNQIIPELFGF